MENQDDTSIVTLAVRMTKRQRAQLDIIAQLNGRTTTEEIRLALEGLIEQARSNPELAAKADEARAEIEREAETRRGAISSLFSAPDGKPEATTTSTRKSKSGATG